MAQLTASSAVPTPPAQSDLAYAVRLRSTQEQESHGEGPPAFTIIAADHREVCRIFDEGLYSTALDFINGAFEIEGDLVAALRLKESRHTNRFLDRIWSMAARLAPSRTETLFQSRKHAANNIRFHYDVSNEF